MPHAVSSNVRHSWHSGFLTAVLAFNAFFDRRDSGAIQITVLHICELLLYSLKLLSHKTRFWSIRVITRSVSILPFTILKTTTTTKTYINTLINQSDKDLYVIRGWYLCDAGFWLFGRNLVKIMLLMDQKPVTWERNESAQNTDNQKLLSHESESSLKLRLFGQIVL